MDPEQRHELKESDLERFARNFGPWWQKHGTTVLLVIALALLAFVAVRYLSTRTDRARENAYTAIAEASNPAALQDVARQYEDVPGLAGRALLSAADMKLQEALIGPGGAQQGLSGAGSESLSPEERTKSLEQASELYQRVIERADSPLLVINARFGFAAAQESLGNFEPAQEQYETIREKAGQTYPALAEQASERLENLETVREPIEFPDPPQAAQGQGGDAPAGGALQGGGLPQELLNLPESGGASGEGSTPPQPGGEMSIPQPTESGEGDIPAIPDAPETQPEGGESGESDGASSEATSGSDADSGDAQSAEDPATSEDAAEQQQ